MKNALRTTIIAIAYCLAAFTIVCFAVGVVKTVAERNENRYATAEECISEHENTGAMTEEGLPLVFDTIEAYEQYLLSSIDYAYDAGSMSQNNVGDYSRYYFAPESVPEDATLVGISVNEGSTTFTYNLDRATNGLNCDTDDETINELTHTLIVSVYSYDLISDYRAYTQHFAEAIDAKLMTGAGVPVDTYEGKVYANVKNLATNTVERMQVGTQRVSCQFKAVGSGQINGKWVTGYFYYPLSLSEEEITELTSLALNYVQIPE